MEPKLPVPNSPETGAYNPQVLPKQAEVLPPHPASFEAAPEIRAQQELQPAALAQNGPTLPAPAPQPMAANATPMVPPLRPLTPADGNPATASDEEVIEKEWVDKAKKIITQTKNDPYQQEKEVSKLQADYLKKRYGKDIKIAED
jgi:hypothetical protein